MRPSLPPLRHVDLPPVWGALHWGAIWLWSRMVDLLPAPEALRPVGYAIAAAGLGFGAWALWQFRGRDTPVEPRRAPRALVATGPYRLTRNPMYRGLVWLTLGYVLIRGELSALPLAALYAWVLTVRFIRPEERALEAAFGDEFRAWAGAVRARL